MVEKKTYAEALAAKYSDREVELYIGDNTGTLIYSDHDVAQKSVIRGTIKSATSDMLTIVTIVRDVAIEIDVNAWCIKGVMPKQESGIGIMTIFGNQEMRKMKR